MRLNDIIENYNPDYIRYYLTSIIPENQDSDFKRKEFQDKNNNLCDTLGNLFSRVMNLCTKYCDGKFESFDSVDNYIADLNPELQSLIKDFV